MFAQSGWPLTEETLATRSSELFQEKAFQEAFQFPFALTVCPTSKL